MKKHKHPGHAAPYYGGDHLKKTLDEAHAAFCGRAIPTRRSWLRKHAPELVIVVSVIVIGVTLLVG